MALPDKELTSRQALIMEPLIANFNAAKARVEGAQKLLNEAQAAMEAHVEEAAEKLAIAAGTDYLFDIGKMKFVDKAAAEAAAAKI